MIAYKNPVGKPMEVARVFRRWTEEEIAKLARAFIDLDLDGEDLHRWCRKSGIDRSPGAIDQKLATLNFFEPKRPAPQNEVRYFKVRGVAEAKRAAEQGLQNQIKLAKLEMAAGVPLYRPRVME